MFGYCYDFTPDVEQTSIDEGYFDLTATRKKSASDIALIIRKAIGQKLKITVSEGIGSNKLVSAVASKLTKPHAFTEIPPGHEAAFLQPLPNKWLPGVGPATSSRLNAAGLPQIRHLAAMPLEMLGLLLGNQAATLHRFARGIDDRPVIPARVPQKTFSHQQTFAGDVTDEEYVEATLRHMADQLFATVRSESRSVRTLTVRVRYNDMAEDQISESLTEPTDLETDVYGRLRMMLRRAWKRRVSLRLVSLKLSNVYDGCFRGELDLQTGSRPRTDHARLAHMIDELRRSHGATVLMRGHDLRLRQPPREALKSPDAQSINSTPRRVVQQTVRSYVALRVRSHYSFLDSTLSPTAIVEQAVRHGMSAVAMTTTCQQHPEWLRHSQEIADRCNFEFPFGKPQFPDFQPPDGSTARDFLRHTVMTGLRHRYGDRASRFEPQVIEELTIIATVGYEAYFLVVWDLLQECRTRGIDWITRGSAADSLVCYCLGISDVCPIRFDLYFKRFLNPERMGIGPERLALRPSVGIAADFVTGFVSVFELVDGGDAALVIYCFWECGDVFHNTSQEQDSPESTASPVIQSSYRSLTPRRTPPASIRVLPSTP